MHRDIHTDTDSGLRILSLFDGIACGFVALKRAGFKIDKYFASEIDKNAIGVSEYNHLDQITQLGDVTKIGGNISEKVPQYLSVTEPNYHNRKITNHYTGGLDLIIGGSPCQGFSIAGKKLNFADPRSALFFEFVRLLKELKPKYFLLENVRMDKDIQNKITETLREIYPETQVYNFNSRLVSAQLRNRFYWTNIPNITPPEDKGILLKDILESGVVDRDKARAILESESRPLRNKEKMYRRYKQTGFTTIVYENSVEDKENIRYLTQTELERLQTLPDGYTKIHKRDVAAGLIGNGWTCDMIAWILSHMKI